MISLRRGAARHVRFNCGCGYGALGNLWLILPSAISKLLVNDPQQVGRASAGQDCAYGEES